MPPPSRTTRFVAAAVFVTATLAFVVLTAFLHLVPADWSLPTTVEDALSMAVIIGASLVCVLSGVARRGPERHAWILIGLGLLAWSAGDAYYLLFLASDPDAPFPSPADGFWLAIYPLAYPGLYLLLRSRVVRIPAKLWLDGLVAALAIAAVGAALIFGAILSSTEGSAAAVATNLAYPLADIVLIGLVAGVLALVGGRPGRSWTLIAAGFALFAIADAVYLYQIARGTYVQAGLLDLGWPAALLVIALASLQPVELVGRFAHDSRLRLLVPVATGVVALGLLAYDHFEPTNLVALVLAVASLLAVLGRLVTSHFENAALLEETRRQATSDLLTGLGNRRALTDDLEVRARMAEHGEPVALAMFDLDGFKPYNDTFGHPAGDALLARLGGKLADAIEGHGSAYRLGGDEFCVLFPADRETAAEVTARCSAALAERGEGFTITSSAGHVCLPTEATDPVVAMQIADQRMYLDKGRGRVPAGRETRDVLLALLQQRQPALREHLREVGQLALAVGRELGLPAERLDELLRAAELHDVGKMAIPDAILDKPGPLTDSEWDFIRRHTIIGEQILATAPAMVPVAHLVRCSHERWDGRGYPDGLAGERIPLGARIVFACDAYDAMTSDRVYRERLDRTAALDELRRHAGSQFDPKVVLALCGVVEAGAHTEVAVRH